MYVWGRGWGQSRSGPESQGCEGQMTVSRQVGVRWLGATPATTRDDHRELGEGPPQGREKRSLLSPRASFHMNAHVCQNSQNTVPGPLPTWSCVNSQGSFTSGPSGARASSTLPPCSTSWPCVGRRPGSSARPVATLQ